jgi:hypothetical protein
MYSCMEMEKWDVKNISGIWWVNENDEGGEFNYYIW